ncbi:MAG: mucoidy inhibitor MuiA family protein [Bernardetiaceae bacterium]|nr:mucoidy inhibitor MuiA family protein [Bernardetiaceae bacterium]
MRKLAVILILFALVFTTAKAQDENVVATKVKEVTVFLSRAQLTHSEEVRLKQGKQTIIFRGISPKFLKETVQVSGSGNAGFTILSVKPQINYLDEKMASQRFQKLEDSLQNYQNKIDKNQDEQEVLNKEIEMMVKNQQITGTNNTLTPAQLAAMADFMKDKMLKNKERLRKLALDLKVYQQEHRRIQQQMRSISSELKISTGEIEVELDSKNPQIANFKLNYLVNEAAWEAQYDLRAENINKPINLTYKASVRQTTGIDWENVKLQISTSNPALGASKPNNPTRWLKLYDPQLYKMQKNAARQKAAAPQRQQEVRVAEDMSLADYETGGWGDDDYESESAADYTASTETPFAINFDISIPYTIPSDGRPIVVEVSKEELSADFVYATVPASEEAAFLVAYATDWQEFNLVSGTANIYFENAYVGETFIDTESAKDSLELSMGRDTRLAVNRKAIKDYNKRKFIGRNVRETKGFEISLRNNRNEGIMLEVEDYIPLSQDSRIEIEVDELSGATYNKETGKVVWRFKMGAGESKKLKLAYTIKYPKGFNLTESVR